MYTLIGDIGNTVTKVCLVRTNNLKIFKIIHLETKKLKSKKYIQKNFRKILRNKSINLNALFSSVVPKLEKIVKNLLLKKYKIKLIEIKDKEIKKIIKINVKNKKQVGSDRIANAVGVYCLYKSDCIVVDFGTATTFDVVTKNGIYNGGIIAPGVYLSIKTLINSADQIPNFSVKKPNKIIGKDTIKALRSGFYWGYSGLINKIISKIEEETKKKYKIIFTGGFASLFKTSIIKSNIIDKNITIKGIIRIFKENENFLKNEKRRI